MNTLSAHVRMYINAPAPNVWDALINPVQIKKYLHGGRQENSKSKMDTAWGTILL